MAGPVAAIAALLPTNSPAPMMPPIEIIVTWRGCSKRLSSGMSLPLFRLAALRAHRMTERCGLCTLQQQRRELRAQLRQGPAAGRPRDVQRRQRLTVLPEHRGGDREIATVVLLIRPGVAAIAGRLDALPDLLRVGEGGRRERCRA